MERPAKTEQSALEIKTKLIYYASHRGEPSVEYDAYADFSIERNLIIGGEETSQQFAQHDLNIRYKSWHVKGYAEASAEVRRLSDDLISQSKKESRTKLRDFEIQDIYNNLDKEIRTAAFKVQYVR